MVRRSISLGLVIAAVAVIACASRTRRRTFEQAEAARRRAEPGCTECAPRRQVCRQKIDTYVVDRAERRAGGPPLVERCVADYLDCLEDEGVEIEDCPR